MWNQTNILFAITWITCIILTIVKKQLWFLCIPFILFVVNEVAFAGGAPSLLFPDKNITENFYDLSMFVTRYGSIDHNYSEGYYPNNDYSITPKQAENNKFAKILELLGATRGDVILDMGCGTCSFGAYCANAGITVIGLTLSGEQVKLCEVKQIKALQRDFTVYYPELDSVADHILLLGSTEHIATGPHHFKSSFVKKHAHMTDMLRICKKYFKKNTHKPQRIFYSGLHVQPEFCHAPELFILQRTYGGTFMLNDPTLNIANAAQKAGYVNKILRDSTKEYYLATALNEQHFGNPTYFFGWSGLSMLALGTLYPYMYYMYVYYVIGLWMWMFDGKHHYVDDTRYSLGTMENRPCTLWWYVGELPKNYD